MQIINNAGEPINIFFIDPVPVHYTTPNENNMYMARHKLISQTEKPVRNSTDTVIFSYNTHQFLIRFVDPERKDADVKIVKGAKDETFEISFDKVSGKLTATLVHPNSEILRTVKYAAQKCKGLKDKAYISCMADAVSPDILKLTESKERVAKYRDAMSNRLRNYTCDDPTLETSRAIYSYPYHINGKTFDVQVLLNMSHAKIWWVDGLVSDEECRVLEKHGKPRLRRATVAAGDGTSIVSESRKAQQASYNEHITRGAADPLYDLQGRLLQITNDHAGFNLTRDGQESFTIIQYNPGDQYVPHCDGTCDATPHVSKGRVATAVMYCMVKDTLYTDKTHPPLCADERL